MTADRLTAALTTIRDEWDNTLEPLPTPSAGKNANKQASKPPIGLEALSIRTEVWEFLASWTRYTIGWWDDVERISAHAPTLAARLLAHVNDLAADETILDELHQLETLAKQLDRAANPPAPTKAYTLAACPLRDGTCSGLLKIDVTDWGQTDMDYKTLVKHSLRCPICGAQKTLAEWRSLIPMQQDGLLPAAQMVVVISNRFKRLVNEAALRKWAQRAEGAPGRRATNVHRHGKDAQGRTLYATEEVVAWCENLYAEGRKRAVA